jgi:dTDP-4-dehydrorhamnose reductase
MKTFLTGGSGTLGTELQKYLKCEAPTREQFDITDSSIIISEGHFDLVIHCAAYIDVARAEVEKEKCFKTNVLGTINLLRIFHDIPFVYISTEHAHNPVNYYSDTKLAGEIAVKALSKNYLIIRTLFKAVPYPYDQAFIDRYTCGDEVTVIAPLIVKEIRKWDRKSKTIYVGTGRKTFYDIAVKSKPGIKKCSYKDIKGVVLAPDYE